MAVITPTVAQYRTALGSSTAYTAGDSVIITDSQSNLQALTTVEIAAFATMNVDSVDSIGDALTWTVAKAQAFAALTSFAFDVDDVVTIVDTAANIANFTAVQLAALSTQRVDTINASDDAVNFTVAQYRALGSIALTAGDVNTIVDTAANLNTLTIAELEGLAGKLVDGINASDDALSFTVAKVNALGAVALTSGDAVTLADTAANLQAMSGSAVSGLDWTDLATENIDTVDSSTDTLSLTAAQASALAGQAANLVTGDVVTLSDTGANIAALNETGAGMAFDELGTELVDVIDATDNVLGLTAAKAVAIASTVAFAAADVVSIADTDANIASLTAAQITQLNTQGADFIDSSQGTSALTVAEALALGNIDIASADTGVLSDTNTNILTLTTAQLQALAGNGFDTFDVTGNAISLTAAKVVALGTVSTTAGDTVTIADDGANIQGLSAATFQALADGAGTIVLDTTENALLLTVAQYNALGTTGSGVTIASGDAVTLRDTGANIATLSSVLGELEDRIVDFINASDDVLTLTTANYSAIFDGGGNDIALSSGDTVTLTGTGAQLIASGFLNSTTNVALAVTRGIDVIDATDNAITLDIANLFTDTGDDGSINTIHFTGLTFGASDTVTVSGPSLDDGGAGESPVDIGELSATEWAALAAAGVDVIDSTQNSTAVTLTAAMLLAMGSIEFTTGDTTVVDDTEANIENLTAAQLANLAANNIDTLADGTGSRTFNFTAAEAVALAGVVIETDDTMAIGDTSTNLNALTVAQITALSATSDGSINASDDLLTLSLAKYTALTSTSAITLTAGDAVTLSDTTATLQALTGSAINAIYAAGVDTIDSTDGSLSFTKTQWEAFQGGSRFFADTDAVTITGTGTELGSLTYTNVRASNVDVIDSSTDLLSVSTANYLLMLNGAAADVLFTAADVVTLATSDAAISALTTTQIGLLEDTGVDLIDSSDAVSISIAQALELGSVAFVTGDAVSVVDSDSNVAGLTAANIAALITGRVDEIETGGGTYALSKAQLVALGTTAVGTPSIALATADTVSFVDTGANIASLTASQLGALDDRFVDSINASNDLLNLTVAQALVFDAGDLTAGDAVTIADTGSAISDMSAADFATLSTAQVDWIDATDNAWSLSVADFTARGNVNFRSGDVVTIEDTGANITGGALATMVAENIDRFDAIDNVVTLSSANALILAGKSFASDDTLNVTDTAATFAALTTVQLGQLAALGVDNVLLTGSAATLSAAQAAALGTMMFSVASNIGVSDTGANLAALTAAQLAALATARVDTIDASDNALSVSTAQGVALGTVAFAAADTVTLAGTGTDFVALTAAQVTQLVANGVDTLDSTDDVVGLSLDAYNALGAATLTAGDVVTVTGGAAGVDALTAAQIGAINTKGVDVLSAGGGAFGFSVAEYSALGTTVLVTGDTVSLADTGAAIAALTSTQIGALDNAFIDTIDASDNVLSLSVAQYNSRGTTGVATGDALTVTGNGSNNTIEGHEGASTLLGGGGNDVLRGNGGDDVLNGGSGRDQLAGGAGADSFVFSSSSHSGSTAATADMIFGFVSGTDHIDLSAIDANWNTGGNQAFSVVTTLTGAGQMAITTSGADRYLWMSMDADAAAEMVIMVAGRAVVASDLIL